MAEDRKKLIEVQDLVVRFGSRRHAFTAVDNVSFHIYQGETFGLVGESGSGKTTIGRAIIRIHPTAGGKILFDGKQINGRISKALDREVTQRIQMIFQDPMSSLNERAKVDYIVSEGLYAGGHHLSESERQAKVASALSDVGLLPEFASRFPHEFSGGQRQRIGIARALIMEPDFIIADEPISALDGSIRAQGLNLLSKLQKERNLTYLFIAHDLSVVRLSATASPSFTRARSWSWRRARSCSPIPCIPTPARCCPPSPSQTPLRSGRKSSLSMTPAAITTARRTSRTGARSSPATLFWQVSLSWKNTANSFDTIS